MVGTAIGPSKRPGIGLLRRNHGRRQDKVLQKLQTKPYSAPRGRLLAVEYRNVVAIGVVMADVFSYSTASST